MTKNELGGWFCNMSFTGHKTIRQDNAKKAMKEINDFITKHVTLLMAEKDRSRAGNNANYEIRQIPLIKPSCVLNEDRQKDVLFVITSQYEHPIEVCIDDTYNIVNDELLINTKRNRLNPYVYLTSKMFMSYEDKKNLIYTEFYMEMDRQWNEFVSRHGFADNIKVKLEEEMEPVSRYILSVLRQNADFYHFAQDSTTTFPGYLRTAENLKFKIDCKCKDIKDSYFTLLVNGKKTENIFETIYENMNKNILESMPIYQNHEFPMFDFSDRITKIV